MSLQAELKERRALDMVLKCLDTGALTEPQAKKATAWVKHRAAEDIMLAKAVPPGPPLTEIVKHGWWVALPNAPFQR
jgi:hypothetical protein